MPDDGSREVRQFDLSARSRTWLLGLRLGVAACLCFGGMVLYQSLTGTVKFRGSPPGEQQPFFWFVCAGGLLVTAWLLWLSRPSTLVVRAALEGEWLRATTHDGREHLLDLATTKVFAPGQGMLVTVRHAGGTLRVLRSAGNELLDHLRRASAGR